MTLPGAYELSTAYCPRGHGRLVDQIGADDDGALSVVRWCHRCTYREEQQLGRQFRREIRAAIGELNQRYADGMAVPL